MTPSVLCVMLTRNMRPQMMNRAIACFHAQTYLEKTLLIFHSGVEMLHLPLMRNVHITHLAQSSIGMSIGSLRNLANALSIGGALNTELIAHWDDDDWSHPERLTEQVALLEKAGADCVGYGEMLFWETSINGLMREYPTGPGVYIPPQSWAGNAWLYANPNPGYCLGTSLLYSRKIRLKYPFPDRQTGEDTVWLHEKRIKRASVTAMTWGERPTLQPRMIASLHAGNTSSAIVPGAREWKRTAEFDSYCREAMKL